jgi:hypothetical protein
MLRNERLLHGEPTVKARAFTEKTLVVTVLIVFLLMHLLAAAILQREGARAGPSEQEKALQLYD